MEHYVHLEALPFGFHFPAELRDKIRYDEATHRLCYQGFMSKVDFDRLHHLSDDWSYRRQLDNGEPEWSIPAPKGRQSIARVGTPGNRSQ